MRTPIPVCEPTPALDEKAWTILMSLRHKKLSPERKAAILRIKENTTYNPDGSVSIQMDDK